jgi:hypothetical protein
MGNYFTSNKVSAKNGSKSIQTSLANEIKEEVTQLPPIPTNTEVDTKRSLSAIPEEVVEIVSEVNEVVIEAEVAAEEVKEVAVEEVKEVAAEEVKEVAVEAEVAAEVVNEVAAEEVKEVAVEAEVAAEVVAEEVKEVIHAQTQSEVPGKKQKKKKQTTD